MNLNRYFATLGLLLGAILGGNAQNYTLQIANLIWVSEAGRLQSVQRHRLPEHD